MRKNFDDIIKFIKTAQPFADGRNLNEPPAALRPSQTEDDGLGLTSGDDGLGLDDAPKAKHTGPAYHSTRDNSVVKMQTAIKDIAAAATGVMNNQNASVLNTANIKAFNDFLAEQYMNREAVKGEELSTSETTDMSKKHVGGTDVRQMDVVMDNISRIGAAKSEMKVDGNWGPRTNNALRHIHAYGDALLKMNNALRLNVPGYSDQESATLEKCVIPGDDDAVRKTSPSVKSENANAALPALTKLVNFTAQVVKALTNNPKLVQFLSGKAHISLDPAKRNVFTLNKDDSEYLKKVEEATTQGRSPYVLNAPIQGTQGKAVQGIPLSALIDQGSFDRFVENLGLTPNQRDRVIVLNKLLKAVGMSPGMDSSAQPSQAKV
jgi:hypothetical protein